MPIDRQATLERLNACCAAFNLTPPPVDFDGEGNENDALFALCDREGISLEWLFRGEGEAKPGLMACARAALDRMTGDELSRAYSALLEQQREGGCPVTTPRRSPAATAPGFGWGFPGAARLVRAAEGIPRNG